MEQEFVNLFDFVIAALAGKIADVPGAIQKATTVQSIVNTGQVLLSALPPGNTTTAVSVALNGLQTAAAIAIAAAHPPTS